MAKAKFKRLGKGPGAACYVVQIIDRTATAERMTYQYFMDRKDARIYAKEQHIPGVRVRIFKANYVLDQDLK